MNKKIRVGFTMIGGGFGTGVYNYLLNLVKVLGSHNCNSVTPVLLFGTDMPDEDVAPFVDIAGVEVFFSPVLNISYKKVALAKALFFGFDSSQKNLFDDMRIDVIFENAQFFGRNIGRPVIAWFPDFQHRHLRHMFSFFGYWRRELGFLTQIFSGRTVMLSSEDARRDCECFYPTTRGRTAVVRFAVPPRVVPTIEQMTDVCLRYSLPNKFFYISNQFSKHKNHFLILDALAILKRRGKEVVVLASGKPYDERHPSYFRSVLDKIHEMRLGENFRILGVVPYSDVLAIMSMSTALINPSLFEGWSTPVEEARTLGVPLILSDLSVHFEQVGNSASYFDRHSASSLADVLENFVPDSNESRKALQSSAFGNAQDRVVEFSAEFSSLVLKLCSSVHKN